MADNDPSRLGIEIGDRLAEWLTPGNLAAMQGEWADMRTTGLVPLWSVPALFCGEPGKPDAFLEGDDQAVFKFGRCLLRWVEVIARAVERGDLRAREPDGLSVLDKGETVTPDCVVRWRDLELWAMQQHGLSVGFPPPEETTDPTPASNSADWRTDPALLKSEKQDRAVRAVLEAKGWPLLSVPDGEKGTVEKICSADYPELFGGSTVFETTWKRGLKRELWRMQSHASYSKRGL